jgi:hypothetical protein
VVPFLDPLLCQIDKRRTELSIPIPLQSELKWKLNQPASIQDPKADVAKTVLTLLMAKDMMFVPYGSTGGATG